MKKIVISFLSFIVCVSLLGQQKVPMAIFGDVFVGDEGIMNSVGPVHLNAKAELNGKVARVANYGHLLWDSIIFYTNDFTDGLLMNENSGNLTIINPDPSTVDANQVLARKTFRYSNYWYQTSFPFDVDVATGIKYNGTALTYQTHYWIQHYDPEKRADRGINDEDNWITYGYAGEPAVTTLEKGVAYRIAVLLTKLPGITDLPADTVGAYANGKFNVDFFAKTANDIEYLFEPQAKGYDLTFADSYGKFTTTESEGWNAMGGLNSTNFFISNATIRYNLSGENKVIYYRKFNDPMWYPLDPSSETGTLRPYGVIFVKTPNDDPAVLQRSSGGGFAFDGGLTLNSTPPIFRSSNNTSKDVIKFEISDTKNISHIYFKFKDGFNKLYNPMEDGIILETGRSVKLEERPNIPIVWSLAKNEKGYDNLLFTNCLPLGDNEIPLGVFIPAAGEYVFSLKEITNGSIKTAILWDKETNSKIDLMKQNYTFNSNSSFNTNDRFVIFFSDVITSIDSFSPEASIYAYVENNILTVKNLLPGDKVQVMDLTGRIIASGVASSDAFSVTLIQKGVYIVNAREGKILKVLNK